MKTKFMGAKIVFAGIAVLLCVGVYIFTEYYTTNKPDTNAIETIKENMRSPGRFYTGETTVQVHSVEDLGFVCKPKCINLHYGKILVEIPYKALEDEEYQQLLADIGITVYSRVDENGNTKYKLTYWGETIEEWSRVE